MSSSNREQTFEQRVPPLALGETTNAAIAASANFWASIQTVVGFQKDLPALGCSDRKATPLLSYAETRLWLLNEFQPNSAALTLPFTLRLRGILDQRALEKSLGEILRRHDILRTNYRYHEGVAICTVSPALPYRLEEIDLSKFSLLERNLNARELAIAQAQKSFNLSEEPLFRAKLLRLDSEEHWLLISIHHIVFDGWSEGVLFQELASLYRHFTTGEPLSLADLPIQYRDYSVWQRQCLTGDYREALLNYWRQQLKTLENQELSVLIDHPRSATTSNRSQIAQFFLSSTLTEKLKAFSRRQKVTLFVSLLAGFKLLLYRYTGQERLYICTPSANRTRQETKGLIGYFVNLLILQTDLSGELSFRDLLHRVRQSVSGAFAYQDLPVQILLEEINGRNIQLSRIMFALQNMPRQAPELWDLDVTLLDIDNGAADFDLFLSITEAEGQLCGRLKYSADLFEADTIAQLVKQYEILLSNLVDYPDSPLASEQLLKIEVSRRSPGTTMTLEASAHNQEHLEPQTDIERKLVAIWQELLGIKRVSVHDNFFELGGHSMLALRLFNQIKQTLGKELPLSTLFQAPTIIKLAGFLEQNLEKQADWSSLVPIQPEGVKPPIFCVHGIGGNVIDLYGLAYHLGSNQPFYGLQAVGLSGQAPLQRIEEMAAHYLQEIQAMCPDGPYCLAGNSMGGVIAFEMAQQLARQGKQVPLLALLDTYGPKYYQPISRRKVLRCHWENLLYLKWPQKLGYLVMLLKLIRWRLRDSLINAMVNFRSGTKTVHQTHQGAAFADSQAGSVAIAEIHRTHTQALRCYRPEPYMGQAILFRVKEQPWWTMRDRTLSWDRWIPNHLEIQDVPGNHNNLLQTQHAQVIATRLQQIVSEL